MKDRILLIDGNSIMNRAFYGIRELTNSEGLHTNAVFGFLNIMAKSIEEEQATHIVIAFDLKAPTFRHKKYEGYKGNRKPMPEELREQMPLIKEILKQMNINICEIEGFEADDVLGTLSYQAEKENIEVTILSGDKDMLQLATDAIKISIPKTRQGSTTTQHYYSKDVQELYNVTPSEFIDVKGLMGDPSDNIPGVPGIGEKTAIKIISQYHSIENAYQHADELPARAANKLKEYYDLAVLSKDLATICTDCNVGINFDECKIHDMYNEKVYKSFKRLEFKSFLNRFEIKKNLPTIDDVFSVVVWDKEQDMKSELKKLSQITYYLFEDGNELIFTCTKNGKDVFYTDSTLLSKDVIIKTVKEMLLDLSIIKVTNDLKIQMHLLNIDLNVDNLSIYDLSLVFYLLNPIKDSYDIDDIANDFLHMTFPSLEELLGKGKSKKSVSTLNKDDVIQYFTKASKILYDGHKIMLESMKSEKLLDLYFKIELPLLYVLKSMEAFGIQVDANQLKEYSSKLSTKIDELQQRIYELAGEKFNIKSPKQLGVILFEKLELPIVKKTKTGYSTAADVLGKLQLKHPIINEIIEYRQLTKLKSTYADGLFDYIGEDQRIHSTFNQKITSTGRISSTEPNMQNIPIKLEIGREIRKVFIPKEDYLFIDADYSQIELRLLAHLSGDDSFIKAFNNEMDIHRLTASQVFHVPLDEVTSIQRRNAKAVNFGIVYGISAFGLSQDLNITRKEAADYIENYFEKYPKVKNFLDETIETAKEVGYVKTMYNRVRPIPELKSSNFMQRSFGERIAMNTPIQGSAADIIKIAMINVYKKLRENDYKSRLILQVHDELLIEAHKDEVDKITKLLVEEMEMAVSLDVPLTVDEHSGYSWYDAK